MVPAYIDGTYAALPPGRRPGVRAVSPYGSTVRMRILYVASEVAGFAKTGGLADVVIDVTAKAPAAPHNGWVVDEFTRLIPAVMNSACQRKCARQLFVPLCRRRRQKPGLSL